MIVPAVGIVIGDDHGGLVPVSLLLEKVDDRHDEVLLVKRVGVSGVAVFDIREP